MLGLAAHVAGWSKDPSTKTGAVIASLDHRVISLGYNGFPRGVTDDGRLYDRATKYKIIVHGESNALLFAVQSVVGCTLYTWPFMSCGPCAAMVVQAGIRRCVAPPADAERALRWADDFSLARSIFTEAGVELDLIEAY